MGGYKWGNESQGKFLFQDRIGVVKKNGPQEA
jgi:hypothetical protein